MILNKSTIDTLPTPPTGYAIHWDEKMAGFWLRVTSTDAKAFILQRRINGKDKRISLGRYGDLTQEPPQTQSVTVFANPPRVRLKVMHTDSAMLEITPGVQGLPCLHTPSQGKPCTPASLLIAPV